MKRSFITLATLFFLFFSSMQAQNLQALFYHASFFSPTEGPYVETYLKVFGNSAKFVKTSDGNFQSSLEITLLFKKDQDIVDFRKYNLLSEEIQDTIEISINFIDQQRLSLPYGAYQLELILKDNNSDGDPIEHAEMISMEYDETEFRFSEFQFIESFSKTEEVNILSKRGFDLIPYVGDFFADEVSTLSFYLELYNLDKKIGQGEDFLFKYYLESFETTISLSDFNRFQKGTAGPVNVILASMPISDLPSGNYNLVVQAVDRNNEELLVSKIFFQRHNPGSQINLDDIQAVDITSTFAEAITDVDSIRFYVACVHPTANQLEKQFLQNVVNSDDVEKMQKFLYNFWSTRNPDYPEAEWNRYRIEVLRVEDRFKTRIKHGFETDMGRVWLKYGAPNTTEFSEHEPNSYPYTMWHYYSLGNQTNKRFIFYNPHLVGTEYILLHSDARGEIYNPYWQVDLHGRNTTLRNYDDSSFDTGWGSRSSSNIIK